MRPTQHTLRADDGYLVVVGWDPDVQSFFAHVEDGSTGDVVVHLGRTPREIPTISSLVAAVSRFAPFPPELVSALRRDASLLPESVFPGVPLS